MANIFVGFHDRKSSSRILKPPGGGTSDIFNTAVTEKKPEFNNLKSSDPVTITNISPTTTPTKEELPCPLNGSATKEDQQNGDKNESNTETPKIETLNIIDQCQKEESQDTKVDGNQCKVEEQDVKTESISSLIHENQHKEVKVTTPEKKVYQRVPPGGYSSGLW